MAGPSSMGARRGFLGLILACFAPIHTEGYVNTACTSRTRPWSSSCSSCPTRRSRGVLQMVNAEQLGLKNRDLELSFFDQAEVFVKAGSGGQGAATFKVLNGRQKGPPDGGSGGKGGDVVFVCYEKLNTLQAFKGRASFHAENGEDGDYSYRNGANGQGVEIQVPPGTVFYDKDTRKVLAELQLEGERWVAARGGSGGMGNAAVKPARGQAGKATPPQAGERRWLELELKLVADVGLVGCPNAGKSTLLSAVSNAKPKIADYPFTTLVPNLGVCDGEFLGFGAGNGIVISDVPGLLEGAHRGLGLGRAFLRHIERCRIIIHVVNGDSPDPVGDLVAINQELALFNPALAVKPQVVVLNKIDLPHVRDALPTLKPRLLEKMGHSRLLEISAASRENCRELMLRVRKLLDKIDALAVAPPPSLRPIDSDSIESEAVSVEGLGQGEWRVSHSALEDVVAVTDWEYYGAAARVLEVMEAIGASRQLVEKGAKEGDMVWVADGKYIEFEPPFSRHAQ